MVTRQGYPVKLCHVLVDTVLGIVMAGLKCSTLCHADSLVEQI